MEKNCFPLLGIEWPMPSIQLPPNDILSTFSPQMNKNFLDGGWPKCLSCEAGFSKGHMAQFHPEIFLFIKNRWVKFLLKKFSTLLGTLGNVCRPIHKIPLKTGGKLPTFNE